MVIPSHTCLNIKGSRAYFHLNIDIINVIIINLDRIIDSGLSVRVRQSVKHGIKNQSF